MSESEELVVVLDCGSGMIKAGFAGEEAPLAKIPNVVGRPKEGKSTMKNTKIGEDAMKHMDDLDIKFPIRQGFIESWEDMEMVWHHTFFNELRVDPSEIKGVLITEAPRNDKLSREKMVQLMFETFDVKNIYFAKQAVMSLFSAGRTTGLVVDAGDNVTNTISVFEGFSIPHTNESGSNAGRVLTKFM
jgi:actin